MLALGFAQRPGGRWTGLLVPASRPLTTVEGCPRHPQRLARRRHADLHCKRLGCHQQRVPCSRFNPSSPATFPCTSKYRVRGVQLVLQASHFRLERAHLRIQRVAFARLCAALLRSQLPKRTLAPRLAPSRQMGAVQPLAAKQPTHLAGLRTALRLLKDPQPILRGELAPLRLGHDLSGADRLSPVPISCSPSNAALELRPLPSGPGTELSFNVIGSLSAVIGVHLHRPTVIPKDAGVSVMLAERGGAETEGERLSAGKCLRTPAILTPPDARHRRAINSKSVRTIVL